MPVALRLNCRKRGWRLNCEAMPCISLGRQSEEPRQRKPRSCKATACVIPMFDNEIVNVVGRFQRVAAGMPGRSPRVAPFGAWGRLIHCIPWADAHGYNVSPLRG